MDTWNALLRVLIALTLGMIVGWERKFRNNEAGPRTHALVAMGSCIVMLVSRYGFDAGTFDTSRVASGIVTGIGFLGAGIIMYQRGALRGLTTAAGVWTTAGIGMCVGGDMILFAALCSAVMVAFQSLSHLPSRLFTNREKYCLLICRRMEDGEKMDFSAFPKGKVLRCSLLREDGQTLCRATLLLSDGEWSDGMLTDAMARDPQLVSVEVSAEV